MDDAQLAGVKRDTTRTYRRWLTFLQDLLYHRSADELEAAVGRAAEVAAINSCPLFEQCRAKVRDSLSLRVRPRKQRLAHARR